MKIRLVFLLAVVLCFQGNTFAQVVSAPISKQQESDFAFEVKTIDEFIERFNNDQYTLIRQYLETNFPKKPISRFDLVRTLFNYQEPLWDKELAAQFVKTVCDTTQEKFLDFYSDTWYAQAECLVKYKGVPKKVTITLQVFVSDRTGAAKWVIVGARAPFLDFSKRLDSKKFLNPISHATDFIGLKRAMEDKMFVRNYLTEKFKESHLNKYLAAVSTGDIVFQQINSITYHFLSLDNWLFTVKEYIRPGRNSGWLIQSLSKRTNAEKEDYKKNILFCD
ncbi:MAG TPA: hypothetical protein PLK63_11070 [Catalimonadaceae bacterium]|nr:hypothetical protein [Catalimonadaceae bacterium]